MTDTKDETIIEEVAETTEREVRLDPEQALDWAGVSVAGRTEPTETEEEVEETDKPEETEEVTPTVAPVETSKVTVEDPGEYTPADYSFEIEIDGEKTLITTPEQAAKFADENADKFTSAQILSFLRKSQTMETKLENDKAEYDKKKAEFDTKTDEANAQQEVVDNIASEIGYLVSKGKLPTVDNKYLNANWQDPEVAKQPGVKEQVALLNYMREENDARAIAGLKPITSAIDAWNAWQLEEKNTAEKDDKVQQTAARRSASSRIAGSSPNPVNIAPKGISVGRALSLNDLDSF